VQTPESSLLSPEFSSRALSDFQVLAPLLPMLTATTTRATYQKTKKQTPHTVRTHHHKQIKTITTNNNKAGNKQSSS